jgi:protein TonB
MIKYFLFLTLIITSNAFSQEIDNNDIVLNNADVDEKPIFKDGIANFYKYIAKNFKVPEVDGYGGKIIVEYIIEKDGSISNFNVIQNIGYGSAEEVTRVFKKCPKWQPGTKNGKVVRTLYRLPITIMSAK